MKNYINHSVLFMVLLVWTACAPSRMQVTQMRDKLDIEQPWRYSIDAQEKPVMKPEFPQAKRAKLKNGLEIFVVSDHRLPIAQLSLVLKAGSAQDTKNLGGLMYLSAHMLKEGAGELSSLAFAEALANIGTDLSVSVAKDMTSIHAEVLSHKVDEAFALLALMVKKPQLGLDDFTRLKSQHQSALKSQQANPSYVAQVNFLAAAYGDKHPYGHPNAGSLDTIKQITMPDIKKAVHDHFGADRAALVVVGDVSLEQIVKLSHAHLDSWQKARVKTHALSEPLELKEMQTKLINRSDSPQTYLLVGHLAASKKDPKLASFEVFQNIIAGMPTSRLGANLREEKGWTYGVASQLNALAQKGPLFITTSVQTPYGADALAEILKELDALKTKPVSEEELARAKSGLLHSYASRFSTLSQVANSVAEQFIYGLADDHEAQFFDQITKVSAEDIIQVAKKVGNREHMVAVAIGDLDALKAPIASMNVGRVTIKEDTSAKP